MDGINERFKELRITCKKNQTEWGKILGITRSGIAAIECGDRKVTDKHLLMLQNWSEKPINIEWLKNGTGEMFLELSLEEEVAEFVAGILKDKNDSFKKKFIGMLCKLDEDGWAALEVVAKSMGQIKND